ncbi:hypothetical protein B5F40_04740 [Gordonibacter sp. An230]|uniref:hypothetical protein n=1 Tax=Gordonibacter sp. An230 TaxID=1965592 RepID=UPI000B393034|nr:hypothetical protein [Gordonibacter sp. An230]OUO91096.1 hypothetical protein B5F40_04740 [Gordonibacter sp. An230]
MRKPEMLPKRTALIAASAVLALSMGALAGCVSSGGADAQRIAELERQINELKSQDSNSGSSSAGTSTGGTGSSSSDGTGTSGSTEGGSGASGSTDGGAGTAGSTGGGSGAAGSTGSGIQITDATAQDFSSRADTLIAEADAAQPGADFGARVTTYMDFEQRFDALDREIDLYDDQKELEYKSGGLGWEDYRSVKVQLDYIEDRLDYAMDSLELRFGIDD